VEIYGCLFLHTILQGPSRPPWSKFHHFPSFFSRTAWRSMELSARYIFPLLYPLFAGSFQEVA